MKNVELKQRFKNKYVIRIAAGAVTIAVLGTGVGAYTVRAEKADQTQEASEEENKADEESAENEEEQETEEAEKAENKLLEALSGDEKREDADREETVYVVAKADGTADNIIVSEWLKNKDGSDTLKDASDLKDITNVKGDETFTQDGDEITWDAKGNDIYYQGTTEKELPVTEKITYYLDGKEVTPEEIAGKSGKVTIRFDYTNHEKVTQIVDGEEHEVYVPFTVMTGMILPEDYSNVEVTNGKVISDGSKKVVVGIAMPGLKDSLEMEEKDLEEEVEIPDYVEITADVENFSLDMTISVIMNDLLGGSSLDEAFDLSGLEESIDTLSDSSGQLAEGSTDLADGLQTLKSSIKEFAAGVNTLKDGVTNYTNGAAQLNEGIGNLSSGVSALTEGAGSLTSGVQAISDSFSGQNGLINGADAIKNGVNTLDKSLNTPMTDAEKQAVAAQADAAVESSFAGGMSDAVAAQASQQFADTMTSDATVNMIYQGLRYSGNGGDGELYTSLYQAAYAQKIQEIMAQGYTQEQAAAYFESVGGPALVQQGVETNLKTLAESVAYGIAQNGKDAMGESVADACETAAKTAAEGAAVSGAEATKATIAAQIEQGGLVSGVQSLSDGVNKLYKEGISPLKSGVDSLADKLPSLTGGIDQLVKGSSTLVSNNGTLVSGASALADAASQLGEGVNKLSDGSQELMEGMVKFDQEGIQKLVDAYRGDAKELLQKLTAVVNAGSDYQTFTQIPEGTKGTVKFILRTEAVKAEEK